MKFHWSAFKVSRGNHAKSIGLVWRGLKALVRVKRAIRERRTRACVNVVCVLAFQAGKRIRANQPVQAGGNDARRKILVAWSIRIGWWRPDLVLRPVSVEWAPRLRRRCEGRDDPPHHMPAGPRFALA